MSKRKREKIFIIHFQPLELYPPIMNIIDFLKKEQGIQLTIISNKKSVKNRLSQYNPGQGVKILRPGMQTDHSLFRYLNYFSFYITGLILLLWYRPKTVFYFETLSSWPALMYKKIRGKRVRVMVHYHEYTEPDLYNNEMFLSKWMYKLERKMYPDFSWISHTNDERMELFRKDIGLEKDLNNIFHIIPNYPPKSWAFGREDSRGLNDPRKLLATGWNASSGLNDNRKKLVFVGSLGFKNMYLQEVIDWLSEHENEFTLDIYSYNIKSDAKELLSGGVLPNVTYHDGCNYFDLPHVLRKYDIGLDLYKPYALNHIHGVSNKVFEYLACGLDVWSSIDKPQTFKYKRENFYPQIIPVDFKNLNSFNHQAAISRVGLTFQPSHYFYENVYPEILEHINNQTKYRRD